MNYNEMIELLEIEDGSELQYFEDMADIIESDDHIEYDAMMRLFSEADTETIASLLNEYFDDIMGGLPGDYNDMYSLLDHIRLELTGLIRGVSEDDPDSMRNFMERFYRFRNWYVYDSSVLVIDRSDPECGVREYEQSVRDAIATARAGRLNGEEYGLDFSMALDYDIDSYEMSLTDLFDSVDDDEEDE